MKLCKQCKTEKPLLDFYKYNETSYFGKCKECTKSNVRNNYRENIDHYKKYEKSRMNLEHRVKARADYVKTESGKKAKKTSTGNYRMNHPIQYAATNIVNNAIRDGKLIKPSNCSKCNVECVPDGHHCDYAYPLDVIWLCRQCHNDWHKVSKPLNGDT